MRVVVTILSTVATAALVAAVFGAGWALRSVRRFGKSGRLASRETRLNLRRGPAYTLDVMPVLPGCSSCS